MDKKYWKIYKIMQDYPYFGRLYFQGLEYCTEQEIREAIERMNAQYPPHTKTCFAYDESPLEDTDVVLCE